MKNNRTESFTLHFSPKQKKSLFFSELPTICNLSLQNGNEYGALVERFWQSKLLKSSLHGSERTERETAGNVIMNTVHGNIVCLSWE